MKVETDQCRRTVDISVNVRCSMFGLLDVLAMDNSLDTEIAYFSSERGKMDFRHDGLSIKNFQSGWFYIREV